MENSLPRMLTGAQTQKPGLEDRTHMTLRLILTLKMPLRILPAADLSMDA